MRVLLVDDEPLARERLRLFLSSIDDVELIGECSSGTEAVDSITKESPDLVFLDIHLPDLDGFEILSELVAESIPLPLVIFQTAFDQHAISAFEVNAVDYLLKPYSRERLCRAVEKARSYLERSNPEDAAPKVESWLADERERRAGENIEYLKRIEIRDRGEVHYVPLKEVDYFQADRNYIEVHTGAHVYLWRQTLAKLERMLDSSKFVRISRSTVVPVDRVVSIETPARGETWVNLRSESRLALSRNLSELQELLKLL